MSKIMRDRKQVGVKTELPDMTIYFEQEAEYKRRIARDKNIRGCIILNGECDRERDIV